jgi:hypothetical protein
MKNTVDNKQDLVVVKRHDKLLIAAKRIFGSKVVIGAWIADRTSGGFCSGRDYVESQYESFTQEEGSNEISLPTHGAVMLEFSNGRCVLFGTSEWAQIELVEDEIIELKTRE